MRPNQNRRMRGRNRPKGPNPLTRSYESNGPDVKIRGTPQHIADKYAQLARDAQAAGDPVAAENYFQHGEHYFRIVSGAQEQHRPANGGYASRAYDDDMDEGDDEGQGGSQNGQGYAGQGYSAYDDQGDPGQQPQPYEMRPESNQGQNRDRFQNRDQRRDQRRFDNNGRPDYQRQDYGRQDGARQDYGRQDRQESRQDNRQDGRPDYRHDGRQDGRAEARGDQRYEPVRAEARPDSRQDTRADNRQDTRQDGRQDNRQERRPDHRAETPRHEAPRVDGPSQADAPQRRERRREETAAPVEEPTGLPAFLMASVRPVTAAAPSEPPAVETEGDAAPAPKPRRRRRPRFEGVAVDEVEVRLPDVDTPTE